MAPSRTTDADIEVTPSFPLEQRNEKGEERLQALQEALGVRILEHIAPNTRIFASQRLPGGNEVWIAQKPHVEQQIDVVRHAEFVPESEERDRQTAGRSFLAEVPTQEVPQLMHAEIGGVDDAVGVGADFRQ